MSVKTCFRCGVKKPLREFYRHPAMADGHLGKCKECAKRDVRENYANKRPEKNAYDRLRANLPKRVQARKEYSASEKGRAASRRAHRRQKTLHPQKYRAHMLLGNAVRDGKVKVQPCWVCGERAEAHHPSYSQPLDVVWLCSKHHREAHKAHKT